MSSAHQAVRSVGVRLQWRPWKRAQASLNWDVAAEGAHAPPKIRIHHNQSSEASKTIQQDKY